VVDIYPYLYRQLVRVSVLNEVNFLPPDCAIVLLLRELLAFCFAVAAVSFGCRCRRSTSKSC